MNEEERTCVICLDGPLEDRPIHLLQCGCRTAWFHSSCETIWIQHLQPEDFPPKCPTCRREVQLRLQYSFRFHAGVNQKFFWWVFSLIGADMFMAFVLSLNELYQAWYLPSHSLLILSLPYVFSSRHDLIYFLHHVRYRYLAFAASWFIHIFKYKKMYTIFPDNTLNFLIFASTIHVISLLCQEIHNYCSYDHYRIDPNIGFVTGYICLHSETLLFRKGPSVSLERDKTSLRRSPRIRAQRSSSI